MAIPTAAIPRSVPIPRAIIVVGIAPIPRTVAVVGIVPIPGTIPSPCAEAAVHIASPVGFIPVIVVKAVHTPRVLVVSLCLYGGVGIGSFHVVKRYHVAACRIGGQNHASPAVVVVGCPAATGIVGVVRHTVYGCTLGHIRLRWHKIQVVLRQRIGKKRPDCESKDYQSFHTKTLLSVLYPYAKISLIRLSA